MYFRSCNKGIWGSWQDTSNSEDSLTKFINYAGIRTKAKSLWIPITFNIHMVLFLSAPFLPSLHSTFLFTTRSFINFWLCLQLQTFPHWKVSTIQSMFSQLDSDYFLNSPGIRDFVIIPHSSWRNASLAMLCYAIFSSYWHLTASLGRRVFIEELSLLSADVVLLIMPKA